MRLILPLGVACGAVLATLAAGPAARAEPIRWSFTAVAEHTGQGRTLDAALDQSTGAFEVSPGQLTTVPVIRYTFGHYQPTSPDDPAVVSDSFIALVTLTDDASGQSTEFRIGVTATEEWEFKPEQGVWEPIHQDLDSGPRERQTFDLGQNRYSVSSEVGTLAVRVEPQTASTPEPATLALAAVGLGAAGVMRLRRRWA
jgi:MYXO-CTERM domain-containing protein